MNKFVIAIFLLLATNFASSQQPILQWAKRFVPSNTNNSPEHSNGRSIAVDRQGNVYSAGLLKYTTDFDPGPSVFTLSANNRFNTSIYISKLSAAGDFIWAIQVPALVEFGNIEISVDKDGDVYLASELRDSTDFDPGTGVYLLAPIGPKDAFVAKYDTGGKLVWAKQFGGPGDTVPGSDVLDVDDNNNVIVCGHFNNTVDFDPGTNKFNLTSTRHVQSFVVKLNSDGDFIWAKQFGDSPDAYSGATIADVKCDVQGNIYAVGVFKGTCDFDPGIDNYTLQGTSLKDGYIAKLDPGGNFVWAKRIGNTTNDQFHFAESRGIDVDSDNNVYTTGNFSGTFDFNPGANTFIQTSNASTSDWYLLKLNAQGDFVWVDVFASSNHDVGADVAVGTDGGVYAIGSIGHVADMDPGPGVFNITTVDQYGASMLTKVNSNGGFIYAAPFEQTGANGGSCLTRRMVVDNSQNIYITGYLVGTVDFDPGPNVYPVSSGYGQAPYVLKLGKCANVTNSTLNISECSSYTLNDETFDSSGTYIRNIANTAGCDSIITLHLIINKRFTEQTKTICDGESFFAGGNSQTIPGIFKDTLSTLLSCDSIVTTYLEVNPRPLPDLGPDKDLCAGTRALISPGSFTQYLWQDMTTTSQFTATLPGLYWVKVMNSFNCSAADSFIVRSILPSPANFLKNADSICSYETLQITSAVTFKQYLWSTGAVEKQVMIGRPGTYLLTVMDANGCVGKDSITVFTRECMQGVYIPGAFTPNNDGKNDVFRALVFGKLMSFRLEIFDRTGQLIFQSTDPYKGWDGLNKGGGYPTRVFVWQCYYQLENQQPGYKKGTIMIVH